jgi:glyoxylase-like metal-dependent hydrolase (beta-lactamase superfamily II)
MPFKTIVPHVYELSLGPVNLWLIEDRDELTLIDTGYTGQEGAILAAVEQLGKKPASIRHILLTHNHPDHCGSLAALKKVTGAQAWMHPADAGAVRGTEQLHRVKTSPGLVNTILFNLFIKNTPGKFPPAAVEHEVQDGDMLLVGGGIHTVHTPGHSQGHTAYLLPQQGGVLIIGDACSNMLGLGYSILYEDIQLGRESLKKLAQMKVAAVCFSHGKALQGQAVRSFAQKWG